MPRPRKKPIERMTSARRGSGHGNDRQFVSALARGLDVMRTFGLEDQWLGNQEIAEKSRLAKATVSRLTYTLTKLGYLIYDDETRKYGLAVGALSLVQPILKRIELRHLVRPFLKTYADMVNAAVGLGSADGLEALYLDVCRGKEAVTLRLDPGSRIDLPTSAMGRALYVAMDEAGREEVLKAVRKRDGRNAARIERGLANAVQDVKELGYCYSAGDWNPDVNGVGVPLQIRQHDMVFALNCGGAAWTMPVARLHKEIGPGLARVAQQVAAQKLSLG